jgi:hypothetical protein
VPIGVNLSRPSASPLDLGWAYWCQQSPKTLVYFIGIEDSIPLASPLRRGTKDPTLVPPLLRGARGNLESTASEIYYGFES